jgi:hypothetical protein
MPMRDLAQAVILADDLNRRGEAEAFRQVQV